MTSMSALECTVNI